ncbi:MAG TPA: Mov34/MPN/PAD-1 family protein [Gemmataceae bacterium]|nr:Mov34/MPN/PAD-1 family protein [Gemmataceae bacterium]
MTPDVHVKRAGLALPELPLGGLRYVLARDGLYLERRTDLYRTSTRIEGPLVGLVPHESRCELGCARVPRILSRVMLAFFEFAYRLHEGEAALVLLYHPQRRLFRWHCPEQTVEVYSSYGRLYAYDAIAFNLPLELPAGYILLGDVHSHGDLGPHPSGIDERDEAHSDGLHIIVGRIGRRGPPEYHVDFVMDRRRFHLAPEEVFEDATCRALPRPPESWIKRIHMKRPRRW